MSPETGAQGRWTACGRVVLFFLLCALLLVCAAPLCRGLPAAWMPVALGSITTLGTLTLTALFLRWDRLRFADVGAAPVRTSLPHASMGFALGLLLVGVQHIAIRMGGHVQWLRTSSAGAAPVAWALLAYLSLAAREELAFRGYPLRRLERFFHIWTAQGVVAVVFAAEHVAGGSTWTNALLGPLVGSLLFGFAALATRGLAVPIGLHAAWNFGQWMLGEKETQGLWAPRIDTGFLPHVNHMRTLGYLLAFGASSIAFRLAGRSRRSDPSEGTG